MEAAEIMHIFWMRKYTHCLSANRVATRQRIKHCTYRSRGSGNVHVRRQNAVQCVTSVTLLVEWLFCARQDFSWGFKAQWVTWNGVESQKHPVLKEEMPCWFPQRDTGQRADWSVLTERLEWLKEPFCTPCWIAKHLAHQILRPHPVVSTKDGNVRLQKCCKLRSQEIGSLWSDIWREHETNLLTCICVINRTTGQVYRCS